MKISNSLKTIALLLVSMLFIAGCSPKEIPVDRPVGTEPEKPINMNQDAETVPTVGSSTEVDTMEKELDDTKIENEDFSDL